MDDENREELSHLQSLADDDDFHAGDAPNFPTMVNINDFLTRAEQADLSHAGGELGSLEQDIEEDLIAEDDRRGSKRNDWRTHWDHTEIRNQAFTSQMPDMVAAYIRMCAEQEMPARPCLERAQVEEVYEIQMVDMFDTSSVDVTLDSRARAIAPALLLAQLVPCAPWRPTVAIKVRVLEAYRVLHVRSPQLAIQSFVKSLCDLHGVPFRPYLCQQFSVAYDLYLDLRRQTDEWVMRALGRDSSWRLKHACPACTYKLKGKDALIFEMLVTMDGNDSLKRVLRREKVPLTDETGEPVVRKSRERVDNRDAGDGYYTSRQQVERGASESFLLQPSLPLAVYWKLQGEDNPCAYRWKNMINNVTSKIHDQEWRTPLAIVEELLDAFGMKLGVGYDVGCHFGTTVANSELGDRAHEKRLKCLVGSFYGHAHNRLCQLQFLATYVEGMGLEDLEGCERFFSRSNGLAKSCRYASRFHRQQEITMYAKHFDSCKMYANLSKFFILKTEGALQAWMQQEKIDSVDRFHEWLVEEKMYLQGLKNARKTNEEMLEMEYVQKLVNLSASQARYKVAAVEARRARDGDGTFTPGMEKEEGRVEELEEMLDIVEHWTTELPKWAATVDGIKKRKYALALDSLELLIVEHIFELTKMNQSQPGYKMRKHIAKALQARSKAMKNTIDRYNDAAIILEPPMPRLTWEQVVEYAFLVDFDILWDTHLDVQSKPWTRPAYRLAMDRYFKILRAREEIKRLNIEIRGVVTWIRNENRFLQRMERNLNSGEGKTEEEVEQDTQMAMQVRLYRRRWGRYDAGHLQRFTKLAQTPGFTGTLQCGVALEHDEVRRRLDELRAQLVPGGGEDEWVDEEELERQELQERLRGLRAEAADVVGEDDEGHEAREEAVAGLLYQISMLAMDDGVRGDE
ncbi:hypothetical protein B0H14DRAFT_3504535 [Mycena olivaceomarginata]|nr:hypothetical protein B0H14DRAFT_3504535 [Mycena olivaceomarginata]